MRPALRARLGALLVLGLAALLSAAASIALLPLLKEGYDTGELPLMLGGLAVSAALAVGAAILSRRARDGAARGILALAAVPPSLVGLAYLALAADTAGDAWRGARLTGLVSVAALEETPILRDGFDGPVGLRLDVTLEHPRLGPGNLFAPQVVMDSGPPPRADEYFGPRFSEGRAAFLREPVLRHLDAGPDDERARSLAVGGTTRLLFELYPAPVRRTPTADRLCTTDDGRGDVATPEGGDLGASAFFASRSGFVVDLGPALTAALRARSAYQGHPDRWREMASRLAPAGLRAAGYAPCDEQRPSAIGGACFCRTPSESPLPAVAPALPERVRLVVLHTLGGPDYGHPERRWRFDPPERTFARWGRPGFGAHWIVWTDGAIWPRRQETGAPPSFRPPDGDAPDQALLARLARDAEPVLSHVAGANTRSLGIEVAHSGRSDDPFPPSQLRSLAWLLRSLLALSQGRLTPRSIVGHKDLDREPAWVGDRCSDDACPAYADAEGRFYRRRVDPPEALFAALVREGLELPRRPAGADRELLRAEAIAEGAVPPARR